MWQRIFGYLGREPTIQDLNETNSTMLEPVESPSVDLNETNSIMSEPVENPSIDDTDGRHPKQGQEKEGSEVEMKLIKKIEEGNFEQIEKLVTPRGLQKCKSNTLLISMKVSFELRQLADTIGPDAVRFKHLADSVEEFTYCLLDPLKTNPYECRDFGDYCLDEILNDAIEFKQKKFFTHPAVHSELNRKWHGRSLMKECKGWKLTFLKFWCLFDLVFSPVLLGLISLRKNWTVAEVYLAYLNAPKYKFWRDTLSYMILLFLHYALCLSPSTIAFSGLEWTILVFYVGRFVIELKQIADVRQWLRLSRDKGNDTYQSSCFKIFSVYTRDCWNKFDFASLVIYFIILILRIITWVSAGSVTNNRALVIAGYLYSFNTLCLTLRAFGQLMEQPKNVGTIQIALFSILRDIRTVLWQFLAVILAFSIAITKIYMSERSFIPSESERHEIACKESGLSCWWTMFSHLGWSLLDRSGESDPMVSVDTPSVLLARLFYASFLIVGVVLLINMLIALLSSTYQKTEENAVREWSFKRAITIQTFDGYDPIPVPLNIIYTIFVTLMRLCKKKEKKEPSLRRYLELTKHLEEKYFAEHANSFPITDGTKGDRVFRETERNRQMLSQILCTTFASRNGNRRTPSHVWASDQGIRIEGPLLTFDCTERCWPDVRYHHHGATCLQPISSEFPHFEVTIIETGKVYWLGIGIVDEEYDSCDMPGWFEQSVGYHTDDGKIFHNISEGGIGTKGPAMARRGDRIRCTVLFEKKRETDSKIPVVFSLNGSEIILQGGENPGKSHIFMDFGKPLFPFIGMSEGSSVLAKMYASEDYGSRMDKLQEDFADIRQKMCTKEDMQHNLKSVKDAMSTSEDYGSRMGKLQEDFADIRQEMCTKEDMRQVVSRLDALFVKLSEKKE